jgi:hypothetical protein
VRQTRERTAISITDSVVMGVSVQLVIGTVYVIKEEKLIMIGARLSALPQTTVPINESAYC